jgi:hypothetical protein
MCLSAKAYLDLLYIHASFLHQFSRAQIDFPAYLSISVPTNTPILYADTQLVHPTHKQEFEI